MTSPLAGRRGYWLRQLGDCAEPDIAAILATIQDYGGGDLLVMKVMEGSTWQGAIDPKTPVQSISDVLAIKQQCADAGAAFCPVALPRGIDPAGEARAHAAIASACRALIVDLQPYAGFWDGIGPGGSSTRSQIPAYCAALRAAAPDAYLVIQPDPSPAGLDGIAFSVIAGAGSFNGFAGQHYVGDTESGRLNVDEEVRRFELLAATGLEPYVALFGSGDTVLPAQFWQRVRDRARGFHVVRLGVMDAKHLQAFAALPLASPATPLAPPAMPAPPSTLPAIASGWTIGNPFLRAVPDQNSVPITALAPDTPVNVLEEGGWYYHVRAGPLEGYLHRDFIRFDAPAPVDAPPASGFLNADPGLLKLSLMPPDLRRIVYDPAATTSRQQQGADTWNRYGGLLAPLATAIGIDPAVAVAVLCIEAGGRGFGSSGRMIIRFENHIFWQHWGAQHPDSFAQHFAFDPNQTWQGHLFRASAGDDWTEFHGDQDAEWQVLSFACALDDTAAKSSISMGAPQIMGFNFAAIGYPSVQQMFDAFAADESRQVIGFFDFVRGPDGDSPMLRALRDADYAGFATGYNGPGQASTYAGLIQAMQEAFSQVFPG